MFKIKQTKKLRQWKQICLQKEKEKEGRNFFFLEG